MILLLISGVAWAQDVPPAPEGTPDWVMWVIGVGGPALLGAIAAAGKMIAKALDRNSKATTARAEAYVGLTAELSSVKEATARAELAATTARDTAAESAAAMGGMLDLVEILSERKRDAHQNTRPTG